MNLFNRKTSTPTKLPDSIYEGGRDLAERASASGRDIAARAIASGQAMASKATEYYRNNPKKVHAAALIGAAALLGLVKNRGLRRS